MPRINRRNKGEILALSSVLASQGYTYQEIQSHVKAVGLPVPSLGFLSRYLSKKARTPQSDAPTLNPSETNLTGVEPKESTSNDQTHKESE